jgi:integrase/recombinase XerD
MSPNVLHRYLDTYLSVREALGFQMRAARTLLRDFVGFLETRGDAGPIRAQWAIDWACAPATRRGAGSAAQRLSMARGFLTYLRASLPDTEVPDSGLVASFRRPTPYLLTAQQITALIQAAQHLGPQGSLRPYTVSTVIGLLASTGLRVGEAIRLTTTDVHLDEVPPFLHIRETKFHKSRLVPLHPTTALQLRHYQGMRTALRSDALADVFFLSEQGHALTHKALGACFTQLCGQVGVRPTASGRRPSLHALRHAFAITRLRKWYQEAADVQALLPRLSVYLGHVRPQESYWYLTATPELFTAAALRFQQYAAGGGARL